MPNHAQAMSMCTRPYMKMQSCVVSARPVAAASAVQECATAYLQQSGKGGFAPKGNRVSKKSAAKVKAGDPHTGEQCNMHIATV